MKKIMLVFPGQGSQYVGMMKDILQESYEALELIKEAEEITGKPLRYVMENGPEDKLNDTRFTQPAIFVHSYVVFKILNEQHHIKYHALAGHSLGELTALCAADVYSFKDGVAIVNKRAELMSRAKNGAMTAVIGLEKEKIDEILKNYMGELVIANYNEPRQIVISGSTWALDKAEKRLKEAGARKVIRLNVSGAFHSKFMYEAQQEFGEFLNNFNFNDPIVPVIPNIEARQVLFAEKLKEDLIKQLTGPVRWVDSINYAVEKLKIDTFVEIGPKRVLSGLIKRIRKDVEVFNVDKWEDIENFKLL